MGVCVRRYIEVFRGFPKQKVPDASPNEIGQKAMVMETVKDLERFLVDPLSGDCVIRSGNDDGSFLRRTAVLWLIRIQVPGPL